MSTEYLFAPDRLDLTGFTLRGYEPGDGPLLNDATNTSFEHLKTYMDWASPNLTLEESERFCREAKARYLLSKDFTLGIFSPDGKRLLGGTGYHLRWGPLSGGSAEIGMWIRGDAAGQGLGSQVLIALLRWGFMDWPWLRIVWRCDTLNLASTRTAEKAGMQKEGHFRNYELAKDGHQRDIYSFAALRDEWLAHNALTPCP